MKTCTIRYLLLVVSEKTNKQKIENHDRNMEIFLIVYYVDIM